MPEVTPGTLMGEPRPVPVAVTPPSLDMQVPVYTTTAVDLATVLMLAVPILNVRMIEGPGAGVATRFVTMGGPSGISSVTSAEADPPIDPIPVTI